jgi:hypothetical protein
MQSQEHNEKLRHQLSELSSTLRKECARFDSERPRDIAAAVMAFVKANVAYQEQVCMEFRHAHARLAGGIAVMGVWCSAYAAVFFQLSKCICMNFHTLQVVRLHDDAAKKMAPGAGADTRASS